MLQADVAIDRVQIESRPAAPGHAKPVIVSDLADEPNGSRSAERSVNGFRL